MGLVNKLVAILLRWLGAQTVYVVRDATGSWQLVFHTEKEAAEAAMLKPTWFYTTYRCLAVAHNLKNK